jgi:hypothetical protein
MLPQPMHEAHEEAYGCVGGGLQTTYMWNEGQKAIKGILVAEGYNLHYHGRTHSPTPEMAQFAFWACNIISIGRCDGCSKNRPVGKLCLD